MSFQPPCYRANPESPYRKLKYRVRNSYDYAIGRLIRDAGFVRIAEMDADWVMRMYERWVDGGKIAFGNILIGKLRTLASFGMMILNDDDCAKFSVLLSKMRFKTAPPRIERVTIEHVQAIREVAHRHFKVGTRLLSLKLFSLN